MLATKPWEEVGEFASLLSPVRHAAAPPLAGAGAFPRWRHTWRELRQSSWWNWAAPAAPPRQAFRLRAQSNCRARACRGEGQERAGRQCSDPTLRSRL